MGRNLSEGDRIRDYRITDRIVSGAFAMTYRGVARDGKDVFIKQFKSPTPLVDWYPAFVEHQNKLRTRMNTTRVKDFAIEIIDQFEDAIPPHSRARCFFQITEFVTRGKDLSELLSASSAVQWHQRVVWAKVIMGSVNHFHQQELVHTDLKPENLFLIEDPTIKAGYSLKVIDLDSAIFEGKRAPWHDNGYVGTPGYYSPEHGSRETIPSAKSDVFSAGLILYELLGHGHPYANLSIDQYRQAVMRHKASPPKLRDRLPRGNDRDVAAIMHRMLSPNPEHRPTAAEVLETLNGRGARTPGPVLPEPPVEPPPSGGKDPKVPKVPKVPKAPASVCLRDEAGKKVIFNVTTTVCGSLLRRLGVGQSQYWDSAFQVRLEHREGVWYAIPNPEAANETCLNKELLSSRIRLQPNDVLSVGRASKGKFMSPLRIELGGDD
jgi:serine/threonine protein kinase